MNTLDTGSTSIQARYQTTVVRLTHDELAKVGHAVNIVVYDAAERLNGIAAIAKGHQNEFRMLALDGYEEQGGWVYFLHPSGTKAYALEWLARQYGLTMADVVAVGDGYNDIEMLAEAGFGVAMGNATEQVQAVAEITSSAIIWTKASLPSSRSMCCMRTESRNCAR